MIVTILLLWATTYLICGFIFALAFVTSGLPKVDESAKGAKWGFRIIIIPGVMIFWPWLMKKWMRAWEKTKR